MSKSGTDLQWPELVGMTGAEAKKIILSQNADLTVQVLREVIFRLVCVLGV